MATTFTQEQGARSSAQLTMSTLASATYIASSAIDLGSALPIDVTIEVEVTPSTTPSGNKQLVIFAQLSLDNSSFGSGPTSGTTTTDEQDLHWIGTVPVKSTGTHRKFFSLSGLPVTRYLKLVVKNDMGVSLTSGYIYKADITGVGT
jgi:hypothetical protein